MKPLRVITSLLAALIMTTAGLMTETPGARAQETPLPTATAVQPLTRFSLCVPITLVVSGTGMEQDRAIIEARLTALGISRSRVVRIGERCLGVDLPPRSNPAPIITAVSRTGYVALADRDKRFLTPGTKVKLVCKQKGCAPGLDTGRTNVQARPRPVLRIVVPMKFVQRGSAHAGLLPGNSPTVTYTSPSAATHCHPARKTTVTRGLRRR